MPLDPSIPLKIDPSLQFDPVAAYKNAQGIQLDNARIAAANNEVANLPQKNALLQAQVAQIPLQQQAAQQSLDSGALELGLKKISALYPLANGVQSQEGLASFLSNAKSLGVDTSDAPTTYDPTTWNQYLSAKKQQVLAAIPPDKQFDMLMKQHASDREDILANNTIQNDKAKITAQFGTNPYATTPAQSPQATTSPLGTGRITNPTPQTSTDNATQTGNLGTSLSQPAQPNALASTISNGLPANWMTAPLNYQQAQLLSPDQLMQRRNSVLSQETDPNKVNQALAYIEGRDQLPSGRGVTQLNIGAKQLAMSADPTLDANRFGADKNFNNSKDGQTVQSLNTAISHLGVLGEYIDGINNGNFVPGNTLKNSFETAFGQSPPNTLKGLAPIVADEIAKAIIPGAGGEHEREALSARLQTQYSPAQLKDMVSAYQKLMAGQLDSISQRYQRSTGRTDFFNPSANYIDQDTLGVLGKYSKRAQAYLAKNPQSQPQDSNVINLDDLK